MVVGFAFSSSCNWSVCCNFIFFKRLKENILKQQTTPQTQGVFKRAVKYGLQKSQITTSQKQKKKIKKITQSFEDNVKDLVSIYSTQNKM